ncbi:MAG: hypothetical protein RMI93_00715, partial [Caldimicrobium sp.]|nr:hypothetical protein [Caldimicrobium sp.]MDW8182116.1 hypothetical protein [Caldimicrobium sp.]
KATSFLWDASLIASSLCSFFKSLMGEGVSEKQNIKDFELMQGEKIYIIEERLLERGKDFQRKELKFKNLFFFMVLKKGLSLFIQTLDKCDL